MSTRKALIVALASWRRGEPAPLDAETALLAAGYDIGVLEEKHRIT